MPVAVGIPPTPTPHVVAFVLPYSAVVLGKLKMFFFIFLGDILVKSVIEKCFTAIWEHKKKWCV